MSDIPIYSIASRSAVSVPGVRMVDQSEGLLGIEWIDGENVKTILVNTEAVANGIPDNAGPTLSAFGVTPGACMVLLRSCIAAVSLVSSESPAQIS